MNKILEKQKMGENYEIEIQSIEDEIEVKISTGGVVSSYTFNPEEWTQFVKVINKADESTKKLF